MAVIHFDQEHMTERFVRYAGIYTQSKEGVPDTPSTPCQFDLARLLRQELQEMGASEVYLDEEKCYVYATIPASIPKAPQELLAARGDAVSKRRENLAPIIGLAAHMDTSDAVDASSHPFIHPQVTRDEEGNAIITSDGTTVLGGDDKAGVTQIMEVAAFLLQQPEIAHGTVRIMFTPDEEVGNGTLHMDPSRFAVDYAYTVDGGGAGELEYENFNAASAFIDIQGVSTHPGSAKDKMINALLLAMELQGLLPQAERPETTEGYEGFYHLEGLSGTADEAHMEYIIRDHNRNRFEARKLVMKEAAETIQKRYPKAQIVCRVEDSYYNMAEKIKPHMHLVENAVQAMEAIGVTPCVQPIRGGTDGARMSFMGIPCPNLFTGAYQYHSKDEYVLAKEMVLGAETVLRILNAYAAYTLDEE